MNKDCYCKINYWQYLLPMIKLSFKWKWVSILENFTSTTVSMTPWIFLMRLMVIFTHVIIWYFNEMFNICNIFITLWFSVFQMIDPWLKDPFKLQVRSISFNEREYKKFIDKVSDSTLKLIFKTLPLIFQWCWQSVSKLSSPRPLQAFSCSFLLKFYQQNKSHLRVQNQIGGPEGNATKLHNRECEYRVGWWTETIFVVSQKYNNDHAACHSVLGGLHKLEQILKITL